MPIVRVGGLGLRPIPGFRNDKRDYDAKAIADTLGLSTSRVGRILGVGPSATSRNLATPKVRIRAAKLERILILLADLYGDFGYAVAWLKTPSVLWGEERDLTAFDLMMGEDWGLDFVLQTVEAMRRGDPLT